VPRLVAEIEATLPGDAIVIDESITASIDLARTVDFDGPGAYVGARGGWHRPGAARRAGSEAGPSGSSGGRAVRGRLGDVQHPGPVDGRRITTSSWSS
jgi:hypothetical protein